MSANDLIRIITACLTLFLVIVGIWYSWETRGMRKVAVSQMKLLKEQIQLSITPDIFPNLIPPKLVAESIMNGKIKMETGETYKTKEELAEGLKYYVQLENAGNAVGYNANLYIYIYASKNYIRSAMSRAFVKPIQVDGIKQHFDFFDQKDRYLSKDELIEIIQNEYNIIIGDLDKYRKFKNRDCMFLFYQDRKNTVYLVVRHFLTNEKGDRFHLKHSFYEFPATPNHT